MKELPRPVSELMRPPVGEAAISRMWRGVADRRAAARARRRPGWAVATLAVVAALAVALWLFPRGFALTQAGPIRLAGGADIGRLAVPHDATASQSFALSDGSRLTLSPGATFTRLESSGHSFSALLGAGRVEVEVVPGGPRQWSIECGLATVEVVGTRFTLERGFDRDGIDRDGTGKPVERVRVEVREGAVLVRGERVPDRVRRLGASESLELRAAQSETALAPSSTPLGAPSPGAVPSAAPSTSASAPARAPSAAWREFARRGDYGDAYRSLGDRGIAGEARSSGVDDLLALADVARLSGHPSEAVPPLRRVVDEHPGDARAALAAFTLGRLQLDSLGQPAAAAQSFAKALSLGIAGPLVEDARARLVEAHARAGNREAAKAAAEQYNRQFPSGRHAAAVKRWVPD